MTAFTHPSDFIQPRVPVKRRGPMARRGSSSTRRRRVAASMDYLLLIVALALVAFGLVMVASASMSIAEKCCDDPFFYVSRHVIALALACCAAAVAYAVPVAWWQRMGVWLFLAGVGLLALVLVPGVGREVNGAIRWIPLGPLNVQPSEMMKLFAVLYVSGYLVRQGDAVATKFSAFIRPMLLVGVAGALILKQPDFGTTTVMLATVMGLLFLGGVSILPFAVLLGGVLTGLVALVLTSEYRMRRVLSFLDPFQDPFDTGYQLSQALIGFGRGEWFGVGLGNGIQKQYFLPEAHTDFLASVIGEELGLVGMLVVILAFAFITWRAFSIGARAEAAGQAFGAYVAQGLGLWIALQALVNIGVNVGMLPTKGLTLPFLSYGSNSLIAACVAVAILLRIDATVRRQEAGGNAGGRQSWMHV